MHHSFFDMVHSISAIYHITLLNFKGIVDAITISVCMIHRTSCRNYCLTNLPLQYPFAKCFRWRQGTKRRCVGTGISPIGFQYQQRRNNHLKFAHNELREDDILENCRSYQNHRNRLHSTLLLFPMQ